ncbi:G2/M phase-specific E3 ubiquitin-protein ligase-like isoform X2 [Girardinichthys multiradiatus]|uniref:G2/M phase-specific E3 ubiquitin-protein ligase-like isoform X2 n=1 Tax=Girardinichthys multiradiatus TaxID=208333 RepID=UPI001FADE93D|nr:G2/M phase-specific E3 ubiquitin-protein ligase-like isoform X2 [Girardinichthys multiradiatus]
MISVALVHGGIKPLFFSWRLYHSIASRPTPPVTLEEVDDRELQEQLQRVITAETRDAIMEASGSLCLLGCSAGLRSLDEKEYFTQQALRAYVEGRTHKALEQFVDGMNAMCLAEKIRSHIEELEPLFVGGPKALQLQDLLDLFSVSFAEPGSNRHRAQNQTVMFWNDWLIEVDEGTRPVTLEQILVFVSVLNSIPPLGFPRRPTIEFLQCDDGSRKLYPEANTCEVTLRLPIHQTYDSFVLYMESGLIQAPTFGFL